MVLCIWEKPWFYMLIHVIHRLSFNNSKSVATTLPPKLTTCWVRLLGILESWAESRGYCGCSTIGQFHKHCQESLVWSGLLSLCIYVSICQNRKTALQYNICCADCQYTTTVMICKQCGEDKLSKEFPHEHLTEDCTQHALLHCLRVSRMRVQCQWYQWRNYYGLGPGEPRGENPGAPSPNGPSGGLQAV
jgi:hypothetical protein